MANLKFSQFNLETSTANVSHIVGYNAIGNTNVRITPGDFFSILGSYLPLAGGVLTGDLSLTPGTLTISTGDLSVGGAILDSNGDAGGAGEFLSSTVTGTDWVSPPGATLPWPYLYNGVGPNWHLIQGESPVTGGTGNTVYGIDAFTGVTNASTSYNTIVGMSSGKLVGSLSAGYNNTLVGAFAGENLGTVAGQNSNYVAIGYQALRLEEGGLRSIAIGSQALYNSNQAGFSSDGNVAIGYKAYYSLETGTQNVAIGQNAGAGGVTGNYGSFNTIVGDSAALNIALAEKNVYIGTWSGYDCQNSIGSTGVGYQALRNNTVDYNVAVGYYAMQAGDGNYRNVAVGAHAGYALDGGADENVLIGYKAGENLTTGNENVAIGYNALGSVTDARKAIAIGHNAMGSTISIPPTNNIAIGVDSLENVTAGSNVAVGNGTGNALTSGIENIFIGQSAGSSTSNNINASTFVGFAAGNTATSSYTTLVGWKAGFNMTNGEDSVCVGAYAGDTITTGDSNTCLGYGSDVGTNTDSNSINLGFNTTGHGSNIAVIGNGSITSWEPGADNTAALGSTSYGFTALVLVSPDGTKWTVTVDNTGTLVVT